MAQLLFTFACAALAGAITSWILGAVFYVRTLRAISAEPRLGVLLWRAIVAWPFALKHLRDEAAANAAKVNKALIAFLACLLVAAAGFSAAANLARLSR